MHTRTESASDRDPAIDLLRGVSILLVVLHHFGLRIPLRSSALADWLPPRLLSALNWNGYEAVFVFFVLSGFLITRNSLRRWGSLAAIDLHAFYLRRFARIAPLLVLLVAVLSLMHLAGVPRFVIDTERQSLGGAILAVFALHLNWYEGSTGYLPGAWDVLWSLSIEEAFYLGFPLLCLTLRSGRLLSVVLAALVLVVPFSLMAITGNEIWKEKAYLPGIGAIAAGVLAALACRRWRPLRGAVAAAGCIGLAGLCACLFAMRELWGWLGDGVMLLLIASTGMLVAALGWRTHEGAPAPRGVGWLCSMGRLSYEIYLGHMFVVFAVVGLYLAVDGDPRHGHLWYVPGVLGCWGLGVLLARHVSLPCGRWLQRRLSPRPRLPEAVAG